MQKIDLIGVSSDIHKILRENVENYLVIHKLKMEINEINDPEMTNLKEPDYPMIQFQGHTLLFRTLSDVRNKLPRLYQLIKNNHIQDHTKKCIKCDTCKCKK